MSITINGEQKKMGLALSGGGFRAAGFHLGVFQKLKEYRLLENIDVFSCVSGGSIAGGFLLANWHKENVLDKLKDYLMTKTIAYEAVILGALSPFHSNLDILQKSYDRDIFKEKKLDDLKEGPRIYFNATNLATGNLFSFVAGGNKKSEMGDYELGYVDAPKCEIARAVAASSAFPPVFTPLHLDKQEYNPLEEDIEFVTLTDGGVYDNMGVNPLVAQINDLDYVIFSDAGKPFSIDETPTEWGPVVLKESLSIMMEQIRGLEFERLKYRYKAGEGPKPLWFSIDSQKGEKQAGDAAFASSIRTHLKRLKAPEINVLTRHGAALVERRISDFAPELIG